MRCCHVILRRREIIKLEVKKVETKFEQWELRNFTVRNGELLTSLFQAQGQRGTSESSGRRSL